ncbi:mitochondrial import inner membrane translocase subunit Tim54 [Biscogniauxia marginata]|nr:mitochondrial import inner membrane translocase subunit Tim54 [Biscogniauxia marginata]
MADSSPPPAAGGSGATSATASAAPASGVNYKAPAANPALRMMGIPNLPKKLPSRNWMIFWALVCSFSGAIIYDKREKKRATAKWSKAVSHLAREPIPSPTQLPRRLTIFLESPPTDGLRPAQDHFSEYVKPILAASGLDWEFVQGRKEGDIRAAVAEKIRRTRQPSDEAQTQEELIQEIRRKNGTPEYHGVQGDIVIGRHTWKEYVRGLHEGWLGPLTAPSSAPKEPAVKPAEGSESAQAGEGGTPEPKPEEKTDQKPERPPQPPPYNTTDDYPTSPLPMLIPAEFSPSTPVTFPHILGFSNTFVRLRRFLNRRHLADDIGREVAAVCLAAAREYREDATATGESEQQTALAEEEKDWPKPVWKEQTTETKPKPREEVAGADADAAPPEKIWTRPVVLDPRIAMRMRRFEIRPEDEARAREIVVPEEEVEGWIKGSLRGLWRWAMAKPEPPKSAWLDE